MKNCERIRIFLNIEGVLVPCGAGLPPIDAESDEGRRYWRWSPLLIDLVNRFDSAIVLRTSLLLLLPLDGFTSRMPIELARRVEGATEPIGKPRMSGLLRTATQYEVISRYVQAKRFKCWCVLDDREEGWSRDNAWRLIRANPELGLSDDSLLSQLRKVLETLQSKC
uniref:HAD domain-containing protein n=1 Tax=Cupriavidus sp. WGlv3 TaxID=2919924 RepID=UPI0035324C5C